MNEWNVTRRDCKRDGVRGLQISVALPLPSANPCAKLISIKSGIIEVFISIFGFGCLENQIKTKKLFLSRARSFFFFFLRTQAEALTPPCGSHQIRAKSKIDNGALLVGNGTIMASNLRLLSPSRKRRVSYERTQQIEPNEKQRPGQ